MRGIKQVLLRRRALTLALTSVSLLASAGLPGAAAAAPGPLTLSKTAPSTATMGTPFQYTIKVGNQGPAPSSSTTVTDQLPANTTLVGFNHSQGACSSSGTPAKVTCALGDVASGSSATVTIVVSAGKTGPVTNTADVTNSAGATATGSATTTISAPPAAGTKPTATTGASQSVTSSSAKLLGTVVPGNQPTGYFFELGTSRSYGMLTPVAYTGTSKATVSAVARNLAQATTYHYRLVAINDSGTSYGADRTFSTSGSRYLGSLNLRSTRIHVRGGNVYAPFTCNSTRACVFRFTIVIRARVAKTKKLATLVVTKNQNGLHTIGAHKTVTEVVGVQPGALAVLRQSKQRRLSGKLTSRPRTNQKGLVKTVTLIYG